MSSFVIPEIESWKDKIIAVRRHLHAHPELSLEKFETSQLVVEHLKGFGYEVTQAIGKTGVMGTLTTGSGSKTIGLRANMDALPVDETTGLSWVRKHPSKMHAYGHDGHITILLAAARY